MKCNICGNDSFCDCNTRKAVRCTKCGSVERTRIMYKFIKKFKLVKQNSNVLHFAPETGLIKILTDKIQNGIYTICDLDPARYKTKYLPVQKFDLTQDIYDLPKNYYDLIIHNHVFEHIPCNITAVFYYIHKSLKAEGIHLFTLPIISGYYKENFDPNMPLDLRVNEFGQDDHVRRFGIKDIEKTLGMCINIPKKYNLLDMFEQDELIEHNIPKYCWFGLTPHTVFMLNKDDYILR